MKGALVAVSLALCYSASAFLLPGLNNISWWNSSSSPPPPTPCKTPLLWEGRFSEWNHNAATNNRYTISFDGVQKRKWIEEEQKSMRPGRRLFKFLILYQEQVTYKIDPNYHTCSKIPMEPWRNFSIPPSAQYEDRYLIGGPEDKLDVSEWSDRQPARHRESWIGGFTENGCWPIFDIFTFTNDTVDIAYTTRFFDLQPGIKNMSVFDVPELCKNMSVGEDDMPSVSPTQPPSWWEQWVPEQWVPEQWVPEQWVPEQWPPAWFKKLYGGGFTPEDDQQNISKTNKPEVNTPELPTFKSTKR